MAIVNVTELYTRGNEGEADREAGVSRAERSGKMRGNNLTRAAARRRARRTSPCGPLKGQRRSGDVARTELGVGAALEHAALTDHVDSVGARDGGQTVRCRMSGVTTRLTHRRRWSCGPSTPGQARAGRRARFRCRGWTSPHLHCQSALVMKTHPRAGWPACG